METFWEFDREKHKNWLKAVFSLKCFQKPLELFIDNEMGIFHQELRKECGPYGCDNKCDFKNWKPQPNTTPHLDCEVCSDWRDVIRDNHTSQRGKVMWKNCEPHLWSQNKWEVAKVFMTDGHKNHKSIGDFDIAALLSLMTQCKHFKRFKLGGLCAQVSNVRNNIMHSASFQLNQEDLHNYLNRIRDLGEVLAQHDPDFESLSKDIDEIQNLDFRLILPDDMAAQEHQAQHEKELEDMLFAAVQLVSENRDTQYALKSKVELLEKRLSERDEGIRTILLSYTTELRRQQEAIAQRDRKIKNMHSAVVQEAFEHTRTIRKLRNLERQMAQQEQETMHVAPVEKACSSHRAQGTTNMNRMMQPHMGACLQGNMEREGMLVWSIYYGKIGSEATERLLERFGHDGSYLLRDSETVQGAYCLCVRKAPFVHTYRLVHSIDGWCLQVSEVRLQRFRTLETLIESYRSGTASDVSIVPLTNPLDKTQLQSINLGQEFVYMETCSSSSSVC